MHKSTKLTPVTRREIYLSWCATRTTQRQLAVRYRVDKRVIGKILMRGRLGDFSVHDSTNKRYRTLEYGLRRLAETEKRLTARAIARESLHLTRYEKTIPGELVHGDTKRLPVIPRLPKNVPKPLRRETLFISIDDATRFLIADILPDRTGESGSLFLEHTLLRLPFPTETYYTDNGGEYRGNSTHPVFTLCTRFSIGQRFTKPRHPWTNGKAERVIQTLLKEWYRRTSFTSYEQRRQSLYAYVDTYNHERKHMGLHGLTPMEKLTLLLNGGDNA
jgi:transposase InsO family protein